MNPQSELHKKIGETLGREILERYCQKQDETSQAIMIPPIPSSEFIDKLPQDGMLMGKNIGEKNKQDSYVAEVEVYRCFEEAKGNHLVFHQLKCTHEQYSALCPNHPCIPKKTCEKVPMDHDCHKLPRDTEGEWDFIILGDHFAALFEVKALSFAKDDSTGVTSKCTVKRNEISDSIQNRNAITFERFCEDAFKQRTRMKNLIKSVNSSVMIYEFTVFPNIFMEEIDEKYLCDGTLLFSDDLENLVSIIEWCESFSSLVATAKTVGDQLRCCLLGLWCINSKNEGDLADFSLSKCILDIDKKLKNSLVTREAVDQANKANRKKKGKRKYPQNPEMIEAPSLFKRYLKIERLTKQQLDVFESDERFLWVEGSAGSGKTIAMLGKIIRLALSTPPEKRILLMRTGYNFCPATKGHLEILNTIEGTKCEEIIYDFPIDENYSNIGQIIAEATTSLSTQLSEKTSKIILLSIKQVLAIKINTFLKRFDYIFVDDYHHLMERSFAEMDDPNSVSSCYSNIVSEGLLPIIKARKGDTNDTCIWILCDAGQSACDLLYGNPNNTDKLEVRGVTTKLDVRESRFTGVRKEFESHFVKSNQLTVNLRNAYEISSMLSIIRRHHEEACFPLRSMIRKHLEETNSHYSSSLQMQSYWAKQETGHFLRGSKPVIYLVRDDDPPIRLEHRRAPFISILIKELEKLRGHYSHLKNKDIAVLLIDEGFPMEQTRDDLKEGVIKRWSTPDDPIAVLKGHDCWSAEWPAVIGIWRFGFASGPLSRQILYNLISRARVYSTMIVYDYKPNSCRGTEQLFEELKQRRDLCRIIEVDYTKQPYEQKFFQQCVFQ